jgi:hypothetical protein
MQKIFEILIIKIYFKCEQRPQVYPAIPILAANYTLFPSSIFLSSMILLTVYDSRRSGNRFIYVLFVLDTPGSLFKIQGMF